MFFKIMEIYAELWYTISEKRIRETFGVEKKMSRHEMWRVFRQYVDKEEYRGIVKRIAEGRGYSYEKYTA